MPLNWQLLHTVDIKGGPKYLGYCVQLSLSLRLPNQFACFLVHAMKTNWCNLVKVTIIWAPQSGTRAEGANRRVWCGTSRWGSDLGVWESIISYRSRFRSNFFVYTDKIWANFWPSMHKHTALEMGKLGHQPKNGTNGRYSRWCLSWVFWVCYWLLQQPAQADSAAHLFRSSWSSHLKFWCFSYLEKVISSALSVVCL